MKNKFEFIIKTEKDLYDELQIIIANLKEEQKSEYVFEGEDLYYLGKGHQWGNGFYFEYVTKSGKKATYYLSGIWDIGTDRYEFINGEFIKLPKIEINENKVDFTNIVFPMVKRVSSKTVASEIKPVKPRKK